MYIKIKFTIRDNHKKKNKKWINRISNQLLKQIKQYKENKIKMSLK